MDLMRFLAKHVIGRERERERERERKRERYNRYIKRKE
jgi:hypothetical protein